MYLEKYYKGQLRLDKAYITLHHKLCLRVFFLEELAYVSTYVIMKPRAVTDAKKTRSNSTPKRPISKLPVSLDAAKETPTSDYVIHMQRD